MTLLLGLLATAPTTREQPVATVAGVVVDARSGQPLVAARVELGTPPQSTLTDAQGRFRFDGVSVGAQALVVALVGYALDARTVDVGASSVDVVVSLADGAAALSEHVTVRGSVFGPREVGVAGQQVLSSGALRQLGGMTLDDPLRAVQTLSGASASDDLSGELAVRGTWFRGLSYTLDDVPARFLVHTLKVYADGGSVSMVSSDVLDRASLLRGAYPQRSEPRVGAALAFTSSEGSRDRLRVNLTASGTSASATADGPLGAARGSWLVSARRSYLDLVLARILHDSSLAFGFSDVFSKAVFDVSSRHQIAATLVAGHSRFEAANVQASTFDLGSANHAGWLAAGMWRHTATSRLTVTHRLFVTGESYDNRDGLDDQVATGRSVDTGYRADATYAPTPTRVVEVGGSIERRATGALHAIQIPGWAILGGEDFSARATNTGGYAQMHWAVGPLTVTPGARIDRFGLIHQWVASPWFLAEVQASERVAIELGVGRHHQSPEFDEVVGRRGTPSLGPLSASPIDIGLDGRLGASTRWQLTAYSRHEQHVVDLPEQYTRRVGGMLVPPSLTTAYANHVEATSRGVEMLLHHKSDAREGWIAYAFGRTRMHDEVTEERFDGDHDQRHTVSAFGRYRVSERTSVNARWRYGSNRPIVGYVDRDVAGLYAVGASRNATRVPAYARLDARVDHTYRWGARRLTMFGEVANITNRRNYRQIPPSLAAGTGQTLDLFRTMFPILPSVGATLEF